MCLQNELCVKLALTFLWALEKYQNHIPRLHLSRVTLRPSQEGHGEVRLQLQIKSTGHDMKLYLHKICVLLAYTDNSFFFIDYQFYRE